MVEKTFPMTKEGLEKLEQELDNLKLVKRPEVIERIKIARSYGDLSENSEYEAAKDEQAFIEGRISTVETMIRYAEIVDNANIDKNEVALGKSVVFQTETGRVWTCCYCGKSGGNSTDRNPKCDRFLYGAGRRRRGGIL